MLADRKLKRRYQLLSSRIAHPPLPLTSKSQDQGQNLGSVCVVGVCARGLDAECGGAEEQQLHACHRGMPAWNPRLGFRILPRLSWRASDSLKHLQDKGGGMECKTLQSVHTFPSGTMTCARAPAPAAAAITSACCFITCSEQREHAGAVTSCIACTPKH